MGLFQSGINTIIQMMSTSNTSPTTGQVWFDGTHLQVNLGGTTYQLDQNIKSTASGVVTLSGGTATVSNALVTANSRIFLTAQALGTVTGGVGLAISARSVGTSFTIKSENVLDTSVVGWIMFEP